MAFAPGPAGPVHLAEAGSGPPVVLLHGLGGDIGFWAAERADWQARFRLILIDSRGHGATPASPGGHSIADLADDVAAVLDAAGIAAAHVLGFSMGGLVAQSLAVRHPGRVDRLVLASTYAVMNPQARLFLDAVLDTYERSQDPAQMYRLIFPWLFSVAFLADPAHDAWLPTDDADLDDQSLADWRAAYLAQRRFDGRAQLGRIAAPTLVIGGGEDRLVDPAGTSALADGVPGAELTVLAGAGHLVNVEQPAAFRASVETFLGGPGALPGQWLTPPASRAASSSRAR
jgi:pimeloyl-ACP methyl ester carboxylesterase